MSAFAFTQMCCENCWSDRNPGRAPYRLEGRRSETCVYCGESTSSGIYVRLYPREVAKAKEVLLATDLVRETAEPDRTLVREIVAERPLRLYNDCGFCGAPCRGEACAAHMDLLDPYEIATRGRAA